MINTKAFHSLSYGLYIISTQAEGKRAGCVVNTFAQVTSKPAQVSVAINKENATTAVVLKAGRFCASVLAQDVPMELIGTFGFKTSAEVDKFAACKFATDEAGIPYVAEHSVARFSVRVKEHLDLGTHILFIGEVEEAEVMESGTGCTDPMTYAYYHQVKGGKTPPKASSYIAEEAGANAANSAAAAVGTNSSAEGSEGAQKPAGQTAWRCTICGHIEYADELPDGFTCPICGKGKEFFEKTA